MMPETHFAMILLGAILIAFAIGVMVGSLAFEWLLKKSIREDIMLPPVTPPERFKDTRRIASKLRAIE